jgi:hypothetical protein
MSDLLFDFDPWPTTICKDGMFDPAELQGQDDVGGYGRSFLGPANEAVSR